MPYFNHFNTPLFKYEFFARLAADSDEKLYNDFFLFLRATDLVNQKEPVCADRDMIKALLVLPHVESLVPKYAECVRESEAAGLILKLLYQFSRSTGEASLRKAIQYVIDHSPEFGAASIIYFWERNRGRAYARETLVNKFEKVFQKYKAVSHLSASRLDSTDRGEFGLGFNDFEDVVGIQSGLSWTNFKRANDYLKFGTTHGNKYRKTKTGPRLLKPVQPFLDPATVWEFPADPKKEGNGIPTIPPEIHLKVEKYNSLYKDEKLFLK